MLRPTITASLYKKAARRDVYGKEFFAPPVPHFVGVVRLEALMQATTVRADSSASRGAAEDLVEEARILLPKWSTASIGDVLKIVDVRIEITGMHPRFNTRGKLDHYEIRGKVRTET